MRAASEGGPECENAGRWNSPCGLAKGAFGTETLFWFYFSEWVGKANAIGWPVRSLLGGRGGSGRSIPTAGNGAEPRSCATSWREGF